jgi:hypothetical protein
MSAWTINITWPTMSKRRVSLLTIVIVENGHLPPGI